MGQKKGIKKSTKNKVPSDLFVVAIGASSGAISAFESFFSHLPTKNNLAIVIIQHLGPHHPSLLPEVIAKFTKIPVFEVEEKMELTSGNIYVIPPGKEMSLEKGCFKLHDILTVSTNKEKYFLIDSFFNSLSKEKTDHAIGVIFSGSGCDGTLGIREIKAAGGLVIIQTPESAEFESMPRSALLTGLADHVLTPAEIAKKIFAYTKEDLQEKFKELSLPLEILDENFQKICQLIRSKKGHDFSFYKKNTIGRRIERRMAIKQIDDFEKYISYLENDPEELEALFFDFLIGVTSFFRDHEFFDELKTQVIANLFKGKTADDIIRVWIPACSTGEEAYSLAILLNEEMENLKQNFKVQIFATDIDTRAIKSARAGLFPVSISTEMSEERLKRYFTFELDRNLYRVNKEIRSQIIFFEQNLIKDPPFSKLDMISCRNLLIYFDLELQNKVMPLFHYALLPGGWLFLGNSESASEFGDLFKTIDRKCKFYQRKSELTIKKRPLTHYFAPLTFSQNTTSLTGKTMANEKKTALSELAEKMMLRKFTPSSVLVNELGDILYLHGNAGIYFELTSGESNMNCLVMAREGLKRDLGAAFHFAVTRKESVNRKNISVKMSAYLELIDLTIQPINQSNEDQSPSSTSLYLIVFEKSSEKISYVSSDIKIPETGNNLEKELVALKLELKAKDDYLQSTNEELESSNEELRLTNERLRSSNEELQSVNEELQSTNEELETSKEELQSINEEMLTMNSELQARVAELTRLNNDINNLASGTGIGTIFVDKQSHVLRFTPAVTKIVNLIPSDIGRPIGHLGLRLIGYSDLEKDIKTTLETLETNENEVQAIDGTWYMMRIIPYHSQENNVEGAVINFVDVTSRKKTELALREAEWKFQALFEKGPIAVAYHQMIYDVSNKPIDYKFIDCNQRYLELTGVDPRGKTCLEAFPGIEKDPFDWIGTFAKVACTGEEIRFEQHLVTNNRWYDCVGYQYRPDHFVAAFLETTERKKIEEALARQNNIFTSLLKSLPIGVFMVEAPSGKPLVANEAALILLGRGILPAANAENIGEVYEAYKQETNEQYPPSEMPIIKAMKGEVSYIDDLVVIRPDGTKSLLEIFGSPVLDTNGNVLAGLVTFHDISNRKEIERTLKENNIHLQELSIQAELATKAKSEFVSNLSHEIRTPLNSILGLTDYLLENSGDQETKVYLTKICKSGQALLSLINNILELSKIESGISSLELKEFMLLPMIRNTVEMLEERAWKKSLSLKLDFDPALTNCCLLSDQLKLQRVILNLLNNAIKFTERGEVKLVVKLETDLVFEVHDTGIGIPQEKRFLLFKRFSQIDSSSTKKYEGTGLGLSICKEVVDQMNGSINVESVEGHGSIFSFKIPFVEVQKKLETEKAHVASSLIYEKELSILLVDDAEENRELIKLYFKKLPYKIDIAVNGSEAVSKFKENKYDIVIMDIQMPVLDGYEATSLIRKWEQLENKTPTPIVGLTGFALIEEQKKCLAAGCNIHATKPIRKADLLRLIYELVKLR